MDSFTEIQVDLAHVPTQSTAIVRLHRPKVLNAISKTMLEELVSALALLKDKKVRVVILTGSGRAFSAGVDLGSAQEIFQPDSDFEAPIAALEEYPGVTIGAINGFAITGGFELALGCDILIASERASFADTHCKWGIHPAWGLSQKLPKIIGPSRARLLSFTGRRVDGATAAAWGLVAEVVPHNELVPTCLTIAKEIVDNHPRLVYRFKKLSKDGFNMSLGAGRDMEVSCAREYASSMTMEDFMEMQRFIASRKKKSKASMRSKL